MRNDQYRKQTRPCTVFTVSETPSSVTEPLAAMKRASSRVVSQLEPRHVGQIVARDDGGDAVGMAGDDMAAEFVADFQRPFEIEPGADVPVSSPWSCRAFRRRHRHRTRFCPRSTPEATTVRHTPLQAIEAPSAMVGTVVAAGDAQPVQLPLRRRRRGRRSRRYR